MKSLNSWLSIRPLMRRSEFEPRSQCPNHCLSIKVLSRSSIAWVVALGRSKPRSPYGWAGAENRSYVEDGLESMEGANGGELAALHQVMSVKGARELNLWACAPRQLPGGRHYAWILGFSVPVFHSPQICLIFTQTQNISALEALGF